MYETKVSYINKELLGHVGVDSGQLMVTDPCYLNKFLNNEFEDVRRYENNNGDILEFGVDFKHYEEIIPKYNKCMNELKSIHQTNIEDRFKACERIKDNSYSYNGSCHQTCYDNRQGGELGGGLGVAFTSGWGDGSYPVYAYYDTSGRISKIEIVTIEDEDDEIE